MISAAPNPVATSEVSSEDDGSTGEVGASSTDATGSGAASASDSWRRPWRVGAATCVLVAYAVSGQLATNEVVVKAGDTLSRIAAEHRVSVQAIVAANGIDDPNVIRVGQVLILPSPTGEASHQVRLGDTLSRIAVIYESTPTAIAARNQLANPDLIRVGQILAIPRTPPPATPPTSVTAPVAAPVAAPAAIAPVVIGPPAAPRAAVPTTTTPSDRLPPTTTPPTTVAQVTGPSGGLVSTMWVVQPGDTIASIAARFGLVPRRLASANALAETDPLLLGQRIYVPQS